MKIMSTVRKFLCFVIVCVAVLHSVYADSRPVTKADLKEAIEQIISHVDTRIDAVNTRIDAVNTRIDAVNTRIDAVQAVLSQEIKNTRREIALMRWIGAFLVAGMFIPMFVFMWKYALMLIFRKEKPEPTKELA